MISLTDGRSGTAPLSSVPSDSSAKTGKSSAEDAKIDKSARDFEAILLSNWLQQAEESFAKVPGGDDDEEDGATAQFTQMAMQSLGSSFAGTGGIGIAKMIATLLHKTEGSSGGKAGTATPETAALSLNRNFLSPALNNGKNLPIR